MKTKNIFKSTLLTAALLMAGGNVWAEGNLTTVNIGQGTVNLPIDYEYCQTNYSDKITDGHFDSMKNGNYALYQINNTEAGTFKIGFWAATKQSDASLTFQILLDGSDEVYTSVTSETLTNTGNWASYNDYSVNLANVPIGKSKLKIIFNSSGTNYTANVNKITMTASNATMYSVTATVSPSAEAGSVAGAGTFAKGSDVVLTATPKWGYQFSKWTIGGNDYTDNPYTISNLSANVDVTATFEEGDAYFLQNVPCELDNNKTNLTGGNINAGGYWENNKNGYSIKYLINVTEAGYYSIIAGIGTKNDGVTINATITNSSNESVLNKTLEVTNNGSWSDFENKYTWGCNLSAGKYTLVFTSYGEAKNTLNMKDVNIAKSDNVSYTIPSDGIGTYCSNFNLDFSGTGATPYIITDGTITDGKIKAVSVNSVVPAGTGIIIKGTAGEISIPVSNTTPASIEGNKLVGVVAATKVEYEATNSYYVMMSGSLAKVTESGIIAANRAYLFFEGGGAGAKSLELSFDGETTGIKTVQSSEFTVNDANSPAYNLSGQRISKGYKGIVVKNGKKFMMK